MDFHIHSQERVEEENDGQDRIESEWNKIHKSKDDFIHARNGDHLLIPFECDYCIFYKLKNHIPRLNHPQDQLLMGCLRRMNLDAFWSRTTSTVRANTLRANRMKKLSDLVGLSTSFIHTDHLPPYDHCGYEVAVQILLASRKGGKYSERYTQFDTIRHLRSTYSNFVRASPQANKTVSALGDFHGNYARLVSDPCGSFFFKRFMEGLKARMGQDWRPNMALSTVLLTQLFKRVEEKISISENQMEKHQWIVFSSYVTLSYVLSLRGNEGRFLDLKGLNKHWNEREDCTKIVLRGKFKGERQEREHHLPCINQTDSGINVRSNIERLISNKRRLGFQTGPAITDFTGKVMSFRILNDMLFEVLTNIFDRNPDLFSRKISSHDDISANYQCFRTFRRTSDTRALEKRVKQPDIDIVNKWKSDEKSKSNKPSLPMHQLYAQFDLFLGPFLRYTKAM